MSDESKPSRYAQRDAAEAARNAALHDQRTVVAADVTNAWGMPKVPDSRVASPERLAYEAYQRGDQLFQIDLIIATTQGSVGFGTHVSRTVRPEARDVLGAIEQQGWHLEHVATSFVEEGSSASKRLLANVGSTVVANHGSLVGLYVFRRANRD